MNFEITTVVVLAIVVLVIMALLKPGATNKKPKLPYEPKARLLSNAELSFFHTLKGTLSDNVTLFSKVRIADIVSIKKGLDSKTRMSYLGRIAQKHVDFVITENKTSKIIAAIELDDSTHGNKSVQKRDQFVDSVFETVDVSLVRFKAKKGYQLEEIISQLEHLNITKKSLSTVDNITTESANLNSSPNEREVTAVDPSQEDKDCPKCGQILVLRKSSNEKRGDFYGCSGYPKCRYIRNI